ncbi:MAG: TIGR01621 family pseudouridine synthase [Campylobacterota bacterium]|nr:TIGR01621 family pseudouridine synthase [Campylobacterota bacterium]
MKKIELIFQNSDFVIINKPTNLNFHSEDEAGAVVLTQKLLNIDQLYSVHRLDKMTSGVLILAKNRQSARLFTELFENRKIEKFYVAISVRKPKKKQGWIKGDMASARRGSYKFVKSSNNPAITQFISKSLRPHERLFLIKPHTGKTHQIRVALKSISAPIAGDIRYANSDDARQEERGYLHAYALRFNFKDEHYEFTCNPDEGERFMSSECIEQLEQFCKPWSLFSS